MRRPPIVLLMLACWLVVSGGASGQARRAILDLSDPGSAIRFGYAAPDLGAARAGRDPAFGSLRGYLELVLARVGEHERVAGRGMPHFEISLGSDYQVVSWLQQGELDAALVSPFVARLLLEQGAAIPVVELWRADHPAGATDSRGHWPVVASPRIPRGSAGTDAERRRRLGPLLQLEGFFQEAEQDAAARADGFELAAASSYDTRFISHLSTHGFLAPIACAARWIEGRLADHTWSRARRNRVERRFWTSLLERSHFTFGADRTIAAAGVQIPIRFDFRTSPPPSSEPWTLRPYTPSESCASSFGLELATEELGTEVAPPIPNDVVVLSPRLVERLGFPSPRLQFETGGGEGSIGEGAPPAAPEGACLAPARARPAWDPHWSDDLCRLFLPDEEDRVLQGIPIESAVLLRSAEAAGWLVPAVGAIHSVPTGYLGVQPLETATWVRFEEEMIAPLRRSQVLREWLTDWYDEGRYPFGLGDLVHLLRTDQADERDPAAALVLPGGGVKSAYQARILDELYRHYLTNPGTPMGRTDSGDRLVVRHVVGTSGGAIVGLLAAQTPPEADAELTALWDLVRSSLDVFPFFNLPRAFSVLLLVWLLSGILSLDLWASREIRRRPTVPPPERAEANTKAQETRFPWGLAAFSLLIVFACPLLIAAVIEREALGSLGAAGLVFVCTVATVHFGFHCVTRQPPAVGNERSIWNRFALPIVFAGLFALVVWLAVAVEPHHLDRLPLVPGRWRATALALLFFGGQILVLWAATSGHFRQLMAPERPRRYLRAMGLVAVHIAATYGLVGVLVLLGITPIFELTGRFWAYLLLCGLASALGISFFGRAIGPEPWLRGGWTRFRKLMADAVSFLDDRDPGEPRVPPPRASALLLFSLALVWWTACLGHALYAGDLSFDFIDCVAKERAADAPAGAPLLHANLVVTGSALERSCTEADEGRAHPAGDVYFCFGGASGCPPVRNPRWHTGRTDDLSHVIDAVVASGSPVPVLPEHLVELSRDCSVPLVDGGFAHNEPIEAARHLGSRQVLIVRSQPDPEALRAAARDYGGAGLPFPSRLVSNLGGIFPFLFERSQELDRTVARSLLVAYVAPDPSHGPFPLLTDFRRPVIEWLRAAAAQDVSRLVGRVQSWGLPQPVARIATPGD